MRQRVLVLSLQEDYSRLLLHKEKKKYKKDLYFYFHEKSEYRLSCEDYMAPFPGQEEG